MIAILCLDDRKGMMFNGRRQSRDRRVVERILELCEKKTLWIHPYSKCLFEGREPENIRIEESFLEKAGKGEYCLVENQGLAKFQAHLEGIVVFWWNRRYPGDFCLDLNLKLWKKIETEDFVGFSHEKVTREVYVK
ncbi:MAG: ribonuclease Z [Lachnospiraceae bacterium]|mgnify:CR=1 FL=1|jgi:hypothetical protein|nr:ribonuclease Z [Lachnospiraceae bacterium]